MAKRVAAPLENWTDNKIARGTDGSEEKRISRKSSLGDAVL